jgi:hypothetical protein
MQLSAKVHFRAATRSEERSFRLLVGRDEAELPATPADIGVLPVPTEAGINLPVVMGDSAKIQNHTY